MELMGLAFIHIAIKYNFKDPDGEFLVGRGEGNQNSAWILLFAWPVYVIVWFIHLAIIVFKAIGEPLNGFAVAIFARAEERR